MSNTGTYAYYKVNKPFGYLSQFTPDKPGQHTLADLFEGPNDVYPIGRLDKDSEGLLLLSNDKNLVRKILAPSSKFKHYYVQLDGDISEAAMTDLRNGVQISINKKKIKTLPAEIDKLKVPPLLPDRNPPVRFRKNIPTSWIIVKIGEGKNRQIRKMCASVGFPVLRIFRFQIGLINIGHLKPGKCSILTETEIKSLVSG